MAGQEANREAGKMDFPVHERNYAGFIKLLTRASIATAIIAAIVVFIIAN